MAQTDISWDPIGRDLLFTPDGDLLVNTNCSTQNGAILLEGKVFNIASPQFGIGFNTEVQGGPRSQAALQLNRWVAQVQADGGNAAWQPLPNVGQDFNFAAQCDYV